MIIINSYAYATGGGGASDVTPDALNTFYNASYDGNVFPTSNNAYFQINGISTSITIKFVSVDLGVGGLKAYYYIANDGATYANTSIPSIGTQISSGDEISISNGEYLIIGIGEEPFFETGGTLYINNISDGDTQLTYINMSATPAGGGGGPP